MATLISKSPEETLRLGQTWGEEARAGWVIGLQGDLGAGKTQLVKGIALGLRSQDRVHSPTFSLMHEYEGGRLPLVHLDLYRLHSPDEIPAAGLDAYLSAPVGVTVVEWADRWFSFVAGSDSKPTLSHAPAWPMNFLRWVTLSHMGEYERHIQYEDFGA